MKWIILIVFIIIFVLIVRHFGNKIMKEDGWYKEK